jgi:hypothetical protein
MLHSTLRTNDVATLAPEKEVWIHYRTFQCVPWCHLISCCHTMVEGENRHETQQLGEYTVYLSSFVIQVVKKVTDSSELAEIASKLSGI